MFDLKERRKAAGYTLDDIADMLNVNKGTVSRWENGKIDTMKRDKILALSNILNVDPFEIVFDDYRDDVITSRMVRVPVIGDIACGVPLLADENVIGYELADAKTVKKPYAYFYLICNGDSMNPTIPNGAKVLIRKQDTIENGEIAAVLVTDDNAATLKRIKFNNNDMMLIPDNREYLPIVANKDNPAKILGKAVQVINTL